MKTVVLSLLALIAISQQAHAGIGEKKSEIVAEACLQPATANLQKHCAALAEEEANAKVLLRAWKAAKAAAVKAANASADVKNHGSKFTVDGVSATCEAAKNAANEFYCEVNGSIGGESNSYAMIIDVHATLQGEKIRTVVLENRSTYVD